MKIFSLRNIIALAAVGGAYAFVRKQGGVKAAFDTLVAKKDAIIEAAPEVLGDLRERARDVVPTA